jgi:hypothetical protein
MLLTCGKYRPNEESRRKGEWIYSLKRCPCGSGQDYVDTIRPSDGRNGIWSAMIYISANQVDNTVLLYLNENLASAVQFNYTESDADYPGNFDDFDEATRFYSETDSFIFSMPNNVAGYHSLIETPDFPFKSDIYQNEMDTFTVNFFKFID